MGRHLTATYQVISASEGEARATAEAIAREQTVEAPPGVGGEALQRRMLGRIDSVEEIAPSLAPAVTLAEEERLFHTRISYAPELVGTELVQLLNVAYGNVSLMNGIRLVDLDIPDAALAALPGPRLGIDGVRALVGAPADRALVCTAIKPVGLSESELADLAGTFARAGVDVVKDDHGLVDQPSAPFRDRVRAVAAAVRAGAAETGRRCSYFPNVTGSVDGLAERLAIAREEGCGGVVLCPGVLGLDVMRAAAARDLGLAIMAHPTHAQSAPGRREGVAPDVLFGDLYRVAGADIVVYVNTGGRFSWPIETCHAIHRRLRGELGPLRPAFPAPAGGVRATDAAQWIERYGPDTALLIGGSLLREGDLLGATRRVVAAAGGSR